MPINVQVPPKIDANAKGISSRDDEIPTCLDNRTIGPTNIAVTVVLFMNADSKPTPPIITAVSRVGSEPNTRAIPCATASSTPLSRSAVPITKIAASITTIPLLKPINASSTVKIPVKISVHSSSNVTTSTETFSVANKTTVMASRVSTIQASMRGGG